MAHASHFAKVGSSYWTKYINYIITYGAYGDGTGNNAGYCGIGEMWGNYFSAVCMDREFRINRGFTSNVIIYLSSDGTSDGRGDEDWYNPGFLYKVDNISDVTSSEIYSSLNGYSTTFEKLINQLKNKTEEYEKVDEAFNSYTDWP